LADPLPRPTNGGGAPSRVYGGGSGRGEGKDEGYLLGLLLERPDLVPEISDELGILSFSAPVYQRVFARLQQMVEGQATIRPTERLSEFPIDEQALISAVAMTRYPELDSGSEAALRLSLSQCLQTLKINARKRRLKAIEAGLRNAQTRDERDRLSAEYQQLAEETEAMKEVRSGAS
jgi:hypothetical protein